MLKALGFIATIAFSSWSASPLSDAYVTRGELLRSNSEQLQTIYPDNINCRDFERTGYQIWHLRSRLSVDLGNWDGAFWVSGPISRGIFVEKGFDLLDVLEAKCGMSA